MTPVHQSIDANNLKSLKILTMCGGDHFALDMNNVSPLEMAAKFGNFEMVKFMVDHNFNEKDKEKRESLNEKFLSIKQNDNNDNDQLVAWDKLGNAMKYAIDQLEVGYAHGQILGYLVGIFMYENRMQKLAFEHLESEVFVKLPKEFHELGGLAIIQKPMETTKFLCNLEISMQIGTYFIEALSQGLQKAPKVDFILPMMKLFKIVPKILHFKSKQYDDLVNHFQKVVIVNEKAYNLLVQKLFLDHINLVKKLISVITQFHSELKQDPHFAEGMLVEQMKSIGYTAIQLAIGNDDENVFNFYEPYVTDWIQDQFRVPSFSLLHLAVTSQSVNYTKRIIWNLMKHESFNEMLERENSNTPLHYAVST